MSLYRHLLLRTSPLLRPSPLLPISSARTFAFSSAEEAAAERRRRKRRLRIEPPLHALRRDPSAPRPPRDPNAPRLPDSTSNLVGPRLNLHNRVQSLIRSFDLDAASSTARHAVFSSVRPTVFTCNAIIAAMYRAKRYEDAVALFRFFFDQSNIVPNVVSYNFLIVTHCEAGRVDEALAYYQRILDTAPFSPSHITYRHLTKGLVDADRLPDALGLLREMITRGHGADSLVYNNVILGFLEKENLEKARELFDELREKCLVFDGTVVATFMDWYFKRGRGKEAMDEYQALLNRQFQMSAATCNALLEVLLKHEKVREADRLFDHMLLKHTPPSFHALNTDTYNIMVNECFKKGDFDGAVEVFHRPPTKPCVMDVGCFNNIIGKLLEKGLLDQAQKLFDEMLEKSVIPDSATYGFFIDYNFKEGKVDDAMRWFESMTNQEGERAPKVRVDSYNKIYEGLAKAGRLSVAMEIFRKMWENGLKPDSTSYEILIASSCKAGLLDQVQTLVEEMVRIRVANPPELRKLVFEAFDKEGRGEEVEKMFTPPRTVASSPRLSTAPSQPVYHNFGAFPPSHNAGNQFPHTGGPQPPHRPHPLAVDVTEQLRSPGHQGTHFSSTPQSGHVADPQTSLFSTSITPQTNASVNEPRFPTQPTSFVGAQTADAMLQPTSTPDSQFLGRASQVTHGNPRPYMGNAQTWDGNVSQANVFHQSPISPQPHHVASFQVPQFSYHAPTNGNPPAPSFGNPQTGSGIPYTSSSQAPNSEKFLGAASQAQTIASVNEPRFPTQPTSFAGAQTAGAMLQPTSTPDSQFLGRASQVTHGNPRPPYMDNAQTWDGTVSQANVFHQSLVSPQPHHVASFQVPQFSYHAPKDGNPRAPSFGYPQSGSGIPYTSSSQTPNSEKFHGAAPQASHVAGFQSSNISTSTHLSANNTQNGMASQVPQSADQKPR